MMTTLYHVVGDRFAAFAQTPRVVTITSLRRALREGPFTYGPDARFLAGQGVREDLADALLEEAGRAGLLGQFALWRRPRRAAGRLSHKHEHHNTLVSTPERLSPDLFEADLLVDERNELLSDHLTGKHLPGMLLVEASRQMAMALYEEHFNQDGRVKASFAVTILNSAFLLYAFPVALRLRTRLLEQRRDTDRLSLHALTEVLQAGRPVFQQESRGLVVSQTAISAVETMRAQEVIMALQAQLGSAS